MAISIEEIVTGRKTFFITPDTSLLPESFLEDYFSLGYECYFVENDKRVDIRRKIDIIINTFRDVILFFNIDYPISDVNWDEIIDNTLRKYNNGTSIGVFYIKRQSREEKLRLEKKYLFEKGLNCGCIQLEYQKKQNFEIIEKILRANQAQGRRKNIRALCSNTCTFQIRFNGGCYNGILQDVSLSHFSFLFSENTIPVKLYEKISDIHFNIRGFLFKSDAVLIMERKVGGKSLYVFAFTSSNGAAGLDQRIHQLLVPVIYQLMSANCKTLLDQLYMSGIEDKSEKDILKTPDFL